MHALVWSNLLEGDLEYSALPQVSHHQLGTEAAQRPDSIWPFTHL